MQEKITTDGQIELRTPYKAAIVVILVKSDAVIKWLSGDGDGRDLGSGTRWKRIRFERAETILSAHRVRQWWRS